MPGILMPTNLAGPANTNAPIFVSYTLWGMNNDFHLADTDTGARGNGTNWPSIYFTTDKDGNPRPSTGPWSIGAYQGGNGPQVRSRKIFQVR
jgi:hypothetical protein